MDTNLHRFSNTWVQLIFLCVKMYTEIVFHIPEKSEETVTSPPSTFTFGAASKPAGASEEATATISAAKAPFTFGSKGDSSTATGIFGAGQFLS